MKVKRIRARSNTERGRAAKLRAASRVRALTRAEAIQLAAYDAAVKKAATGCKRATVEKARRNPKSAKKRQRGSASRDAIAIVLALALWSDGSAEQGDVEWQWERRPKPGRPGSATASIDVNSVFPSLMEEASADAIQDMGIPEFPRETGRAMNVRVLLDDSEVGEHWVSVISLTTDWETAAHDVVNEVHKLLKRYDVTTLLRWNIYVTGRVYGI